jgi:hypothetical protein
MDAALEGVPEQALPAGGAACARKGAFILETGRAATDNGQLPPGDTVPTLTPPSVVVNQPPTTRPRPLITTTTTRPPSPTTTTTVAPSP